MNRTSLTPHSYVTRLNVFYQRDRSVKTILTPDGRLDPFIDAVGTIVQRATIDGVEVCDKYLEAAEEFVKGGYATSLGRISDRSKALDPIAHSLNGRSIIDGTNYYLYLDEYEPYIFEEDTEIYQFVWRFLQGYYPQLRRKNYLLDWYK